MHSISEKSSDFLKNMHFGIIFFFQEFSFLQICWSDLVGAIGSLEAVDMDLLLILSRNDFKELLNAKKCFNFESINYSVK